LGGRFMRIGFALGCALALAVLTSCSDDNADADGDGKISPKERATELARDGYLSMQPGRWRTSLKLTEIDVPRLGRKERQQAMREAEEQFAGVSCLSEAEAAKPGADFFSGKGGEDCAYSKFDLAGNRARMSLSCGMGGAGKVSMDLDGTSSETNFEFDTKVTADIPLAGKIKMTGTLTGKHEGACQGNE
jgi:hypothetical protein